MRLSIEASPPGRAFATRRTQVFGEDELLIGFPEVTEALREAGIRSVCCVSLVVGDRALGALNVGSLEPSKRAVHQPGRSFRLSSWRGGFFRFYLSHEFLQHRRRVVLLPD